MIHQLRKILKSLKLLNVAMVFKRKIAPAYKVFAPCTPHLLIGVHRALHLAQEKNITTGSDYLEFGIFRGFTFWYAQALAQDMGIKNMRFFGFDSFFGLPPLATIDQGGDFQEANYFCSRRDVEDYLNQYHVDWDKTFLVEGFFDKTLTEAARSEYHLKRCSVCVIDCDLYVSTKAVLEFIGPLVQPETIVLFDDWNSYNADPNKGERKAFADFLQQNQVFEAQELYPIGAHGQAFLLKRK